MTHLARVCAGQGIGPLYLFSTTRDPEGNRNAMTCDPSAAQAAWLSLAQALDLLEEMGRKTPCQANPAPFVSDELTDRREALKACGHCPVLDLCRTYAEVSDEPWHVWGGQDRPTARRRKDTVA